MEELIKKGESERLEFKVILPETSKYIKTIIAFSNGAGGKLIIGVNDNRKIIGVDKNQVFKIKEQISNAINDCCEPAIYPHISISTINDKTVVIVEIFPGINTPYYLKSKGIQKGTYIRTDTTTRIADSIKIQELELQGRKVSYDKIIYRGGLVSEKEINKLCNKINTYRKNYYLLHGIELYNKIVSKQNLINWEILKEQDNELLPTNAFMLFIGEGFPFSKIQCARFKGIDKSIFIDKKEYRGSLFDQLESAYQFILEHLHVEIEIKELVRKEIYEISPTIIREILLNALCHRLYIQKSCIQVSIYDDRLVVVSPGSLYGGLTIEEAISGYSVTRNEGIAEILSQSMLIENWGTGLQRVIQKCKEDHLKKPKFEVSASAFSVTIFRKTSGTREEVAQISGTNEEVAQTSGTSEEVAQISGKNRKELQKLNRQKLIIQLLKESHNITVDEICLKLGFAKRTVYRDLSQLSKQGIINKVSVNRKKYWIINDKR